MGGGGWGWWCSGTKFQNRGVRSIWSKNSGSLAYLRITDSLSHTRYVETNKFGGFVASHVSSQTLTKATKMTKVTKLIEIHAYDYVKYWHNNSHQRLPNSVISMFCEFHSSLPFIDNAKCSAHFPEVSSSTSYIYYL